ncbi:MAG: peptide chain release factor N(5)-glutamine methyltransferase [Deltaproteobacteria bacterium]|nr:peptide chain release factor N(5)-glutamine methyltransferase [Deltaproteobacteria bacterium]
MVEERAKGKPLGHVIGRQQFLGVELIVASGALVPREETELLARTALRRIGELVSTPKLIDMCCGVGNLACAIAVHAPQARAWASDLTDGCIAVARRNVEHLGLGDRVTVLQGDLFTPLVGLELEGEIDVVICNPPYISTGRLSGDRASLLEHEPREAFDAGPYGLAIHQRVVKEALPYLRVGGWLMFEIGVGQDRQVKLLFDRTRAYEDVELVSDEGGNPRVIIGRKK